MDDSTTPFGTGAAPVLRLHYLAVGSHVLRARMVIKGVLVAERRLPFNVTNVNPTISILEPSTGASFCVNQNIDFRARVSDPDTPPDFTLPDYGGKLAGGSAAPFATLGASAHWAPTPSASAPAPRSASR